MARYGQRPENALKRANEFMEIGKPARALDTLQEVFRNKKWAYNWSESVLEPIMFRYLELCVELRKSHIAKESLFQYRNMFQSVNVGSLENVIRGYLRMAEKRTETAREQSTQAVVDIDDLDNLATPESILLSAVSGEDSQDRSDRTILTPWVKFLWESYCQCLELLRTNAHVETLYHDIARMAFQFCLKYTRKTEFRKLCDKLRKHLEDICKLTVQTGNVSINKPETQQLNLETRLFQLEHAIQMELWQEAYKAIEDIHNLMNMSKKTPVAKTMANFYTKLALVFWKAGHYLFHAAAFLKLFQLSRELKKNVTPDELQKMACKVLVATLSIPLPSLHPEFDRFIEMDKTPAEKAQRLAILLGLPQPPTRVSLLKEIVHLNVIDLASPDLQNLYKWLEVEFDPLTLCNKAKIVIDSLEEDESLSQYVGAMRDVALVRLVRQVAQCYQSIRFSRLIELAVFTDRFHLERLLVDCVRHNDMQIRIDHANKCIHFGVELSEASRESVAEGPFLQEMPSEQVRGQLMRASVVLTKAAAAVAPHHRRAERERLRAAAVRNYHETKLGEHQRILQRHKIIEDRKEYIERLNIVREEEEQRRQEELARQHMLVEQQRLETEREEREKRRQQNEYQLIRDRHLKEKMQQISQTTAGQKVLKKLDEKDIKKIDAQVIAEKEAEELLKERRELQARLKSQEKRIDYFERAKRIEEIPLLQKSLEEKQVQDKAFWEQQEEERIKQIIQARELDIATAARLKRIIAHKEEFVKKLTANRRSEHNTRVQEYQKLLTEERTRRLAERAADRREHRRTEWHREKEEAAIRKAEEEKRMREEEERRIREKEEADRVEEERAAREKREQAQREHLEMVERAAARAKAREEEIERKKAAEAAAWRHSRAAEEAKRTEEKKDTWRGGEEKKDTWRAADEKKEPWKPPSEEKKEPWRPTRLRDSGWRDGEKGKETDEKKDSDDRRPPRDLDDRRPPRDSDDRRPPRDLDDRRPPRDLDDRRPPRDLDDRRPPRDLDDRRPPRDVDDRRPPTRDFDDRRPPRDLDDRRPPRDSDDRRPPRDGDRPIWRSTRDADGPDKERDRESRFGERDRFPRRDDKFEDRRDDRSGDRREERPGGGFSSWRRGESPPTERTWRFGNKDAPKEKEGETFRDRDKGGFRDREREPREDRDRAIPRDKDFKDRDVGKDKEGLRGREPPPRERDGVRDVPPRSREPVRERDPPKDREPPKEKEPARKPPPEDKSNDADDDDWQQVKHR